MGHNTTIVLDNDHFYKYEENPQQLIKEIKEVMGGLSSQERDRPGMIFGRTHDADSYSLLMVGGNMAELMGMTRYYGSGMLDQQLHMLKEAAANLGYRLVRKTTRKGDRRKSGEKKTGKGMP